MGTDIHLAVERRRPDGKWERCFPPAGVRLLDDWFYVNQADAGYVRHSWYSERNYTLFAVLADVRNGYGFAGVPTFVPIKPIAMPRGLPVDISPEVSRLLDDYEADDISLGDHDFSWLLVSELLAYNWDQTQTVVGVVPVEAFNERLAKYGKEFPAPSCPYEDWSGGISGSDIQTVEGKLLIRGMKATNPPGTRLYVSDAWHSPLRSRCDTFLEKVLPELQKLGPPDAVRIVFGFDS